MNTKIDQLICDLDAVMQGEAPGDVLQPEFTPPVMTALRDLLKPVVLDCRTCFAFVPDRNCFSPETCRAGDKYVPCTFVPMWEAK